MHRPRSRHEHKFSKCKTCLGMMMLICIKLSMALKCQFYMQVTKIIVIISTQTQR